MTGLFEKAVQRVEALPPEEQDAIANQILLALDDEQSWLASFESRREEFAQMARQARLDREGGEVRPLEELLEG